MDFWTLFLFTCGLLDTFWPGFLGGVGAWDVAAVTGRGGGYETWRRPRDVAEATGRDGGHRTRRRSRDAAEVTARRGNREIQRSPDEAEAMGRGGGHRTRRRSPDAAEVKARRGNREIRRLPDAAEATGCGGGHRMRQRSRPEGATGRSGLTRREEDARRSRLPRLSWDHGQERRTGFLRDAGTQRQLRVTRGTPHFHEDRRSSPLLEAVGCLALERNDNRQRLGGAKAAVFFSAGSTEDAKEVPMAVMEFRELDAVLAELDESGKSVFTVLGRDVAADLRKLKICVICYEGVLPTAHEKLRNPH
ncbi:uncharacterized protein LOC144086279 isoform X2 [Stigmatopora argus]